MALYTARQVLLLFALLAAATAGLAVREWRAAHPDLADWLEGIDRATPRPASAPDSAPEQLPPRHRSPMPERPLLDVNSATPDELARVPGVGPSLAARIVERRRSAGAFASIEQLRGVKGIGRAKLDRLRAVLTVGD